MTAMETQQSATSNQVSHLTWLPPIIVGVIGAGGATLVGRLINGG
ncbi:hypothetical protein [Leucobacter coleopterorum]|nr:hypothetical protein [Leucobacter coleopterorum]